MGVLPPVLIELKALSGNFNAKMAEAKAELAGLNATGNAQMAGLAKAGRVAAVGVAAIGVAAIGVAAVTVHMASKFQESTTQLITGAGESEAKIEMVREGILKMAGAVGTMPEELSKGMYLIGSAGYHGADGLKVLKAAAQGAKVGGAEMAVVANGLTTAMTDYHIPASRANAVTSAMVATVASGKMKMQDLASSLGMVMPKAAALGVSFQDVTGGLATMTATGMTARRASMNLANTLMALGAPGKAASKALASIGLSAQEVKDSLSKKGLQATLVDITDHVGTKFPKGSVAGVTALKQILGGTTGFGTALALTGTHATAFASNVKNIGGALNGQTKSVEGFALTQKDLAFQMDSAKAALSAMGIKLGTALLPVVTKAMEYFNNTAVPAIQHFAEGFSEKVMPAIKKAEGFISGTLWPAIKKLASLITGTVVPALASLIGWLASNSAWLTPIAVGIGAMLLAWKAYTTYLAIVAAATKAYGIAQGIVNVVMAANPIGIVVLALVGLAAGLVYAYKTSETFRATIDTAFQGVKIIVGNVIGVVITIIRSMLKAWTTVIGGILSAAATIAEKLHLPFADSLRKASNSFNTLATSADKKLRGISDSAGKWGEETGKNYAAGIVRHKELAAINAGAVAAGVKHALVVPSAEALGAAVADGMAAGIRRNKQLAILEAQSMAAGVKYALHAVIKPGSPSRMTTLLGEQIGQGLVVGMRSTRAQVAAAAQSLAASLASNLRSPSKIMIEFGKFVGRDLIIGMRGTSANVAAASKALAAQVAGVFTERYVKKDTALVAHLRAEIVHLGPLVGKHKNLADNLIRAREALVAALAHKGRDADFGAAAANNLMKNLANQNTALARIATAREGIAAKLKAAQSQLADAVKVRNDFADSVADSAAKFGSVANIQASDGTLGSDDIVTQLKTRLGEITNFTANMARLKASGLNKTAYEQLIGGGVDASKAAAAALAAGGASVIANVNALQGKINAQGVALGNASSRVLYQAGVDTAAGLVKGLDSQTKSLAAASARMAKVLVASIKRALGIHSASTVMAGEVGQFIPLGVVKGIESERSKVVAAMASLVLVPKVVPLGFSSGGGTQGAVMSNLGTAVTPRSPKSEGSSGNSDVVAAIQALGDRFALELSRKDRTIQTMQRQLAGAQ